jgi:hypothetical protein
VLLLLVPFHPQLLLLLLLLLLGFDRSLLWHGLE